MEAAMLINLAATHHKRADANQDGICLPTLVRVTFAAEW